MPVVSIIVPVYKVEKYLHRCLDSILAQTFIDFECVLVDDGSPDNCPAICDEYAKKDSRIIVIHKENAGVAAARDSGLNKSAGKFIMHVDSDDWLDPNALKLLCKKQQETDADIVLGNVKILHSWGNKKYVYPEIQNDIPPISYYLLYCYHAFHAKLYRKAIFQDYIVPCIPHIGEDVIVNVQAFSAIQPGKLQKINETVYVYDCTNASSAVSDLKKRMKKFTSYLDYPHMASCLWTERYLNNTQDALVKIASLYLSYQAMIYYIRYNYDNVTKNEIAIFYENYYKILANSKYFNTMPFRWRIAIPVFYFSMPIGKAYIKALDFLIYIARKFMSVTNIKNERDHII
jgi:glycosyltransferase involved in cell wall biosynthesis